ncbi:MAG: Smr/MutS family protein [Alphaproteobacteria bacterium]|nr:Smr/MutS family protein [Alphaproteobacteria bacterium]MDD9919238.1 Smr/MutS family protein [Alphaproteobacteria bacterium]
MFNDNDDDLWGAAIADVKPLKGKDKHPKAHNSNTTRTYNGFHEPADGVNTTESATIGQVPTPGREQMKTSVLEISQNTSDCIAGHGEGVDSKLRKKLSRGEFDFSARLDLHGFLEGDAWMAVMDFLHEAADHGHRCVLIIHGKGKGWGANGEMGVIKSQIANWLAHHPKVLAFHTATPKDGGKGAMYVYLRRNRTF